MQFVNTFTIEQSTRAFLILIWIHAVVSENKNFKSTVNGQPILLTKFFVSNTYIIKGSIKKEKIGYRMTVVD